MAFNHSKLSAQSIEIIQRSLGCGRLGHAYLFTGDELDELEVAARTLAKTLNCQSPVKIEDRAIDCCDACGSCHRIDGESHADIHWARPEAKSRVITVEQVRDLVREIQLKPTEAPYKIAVVSSAERMNVQGANAFLKTLEEPPRNSVLILISTEPARILETILSRCLQVNFARDGNRPLAEDETAWLAHFASIAANDQKTLLGRYRLLDAVLQRLGQLRAQLQESLTTRSPLQKHDEVERDLRERWETELAAAIESEYRRHRTDLLGLVHWWLRDVWLHTIASSTDLLRFPGILGTQIIGRKISRREATENLQTLEQTQRLLQTNVQEALALEVAFLKLHF